MIFLTFTFLTNFLFFRKVFYGLILSFIKWFPVFFIEISHIYWVIVAANRYRYRYGEQHLLLRISFNNNKYLPFFMNTLSGKCCWFMIMRFQSYDSRANSTNFPYRKKLSPFSSIISYLYDIIWYVCIYVWKCVSKQIQSYFNEYIDVCVCRDVLMYVMFDSKSCGFVRIIRQPPDHKY